MALSNFFDALAPSSSSDLDLLFPKQIEFPIESLSHTDFLDCKVLRLDPCVSDISPSPTFCQEKLKLSGMSALAYSVVSSLFLVNIVC